MAIPGYQTAPRYYVETSLNPSDARNYYVQISGIHLKGNNKFR